MAKKRYKKKRMKLYRINNGYMGVCEICVVAENEWRARKIAEEFFREEAARDHAENEESYWTNLNVYLESEDTSKETVVVIPC